MDLTVFIPTRGRMGFSQQITLRELRDFSSVTPYIVCPPEEERHHRTYHGHVLPCPAEGIGPTRQWILENSPTRGVVMLDDDQYFSKRRAPNYEPRPLDRVDGKDLDTMFDWISQQLDGGFAHGGISARQGNQHIAYQYTDCIRVNNAHFFDRDVFLGEGMRFDAIPVMEDFWVTLSLLLLGYPNRVAYHFCWSQRGSGTKGGCSLYRTAEVQKQAAEELHDMFPDYVKVVTKSSTSAGDVFQQRTDVNIAWIKAWKDRYPASRKLDIEQRADVFTKRRPLVGDEDYDG